jgi:hypothetical protein
VLLLLWPLVVLQPVLVLLWLQQLVLMLCVLRRHGLLLQEAFLGCCLAADSSAACPAAHLPAP